MQLLRYFIVIFACAAVICIAPSYADVIVDRDLSFGSFIVKRNDANYDITVDTDGSITYDAAGFVQISPPLTGVYDIINLTPFAAIMSVTITQVAPLSAPGNTFQMLNFQETHPATVSAGGVARIEVGGTARTSGNGMAYPDDTYTGSIEILINF